MVEISPNHKFLNKINANDINLQLHIEILQVDFQNLEYAL